MAGNISTKAGETMKKYLKYLYFPAIFIYLEIMFKIFAGKSISVNIIYPILSAVTLGGILAFLTSLFQKKAGRIIGYTIISVMCILFCVQLVYINVFKTSFTFALVFGGAGGANALTEFAGETIDGILDNIIGIIMCILPIPATIILDVKLELIRKEEKKLNLITLLAVITLHVCSLVLVAFSGNDGYTAKVLYFDHFVRDIGFDKLGVITSMKIDIKEMIFGASDSAGDITGSQAVPTLSGVGETTEYETTTADETTTGDGTIGDGTGTEGDDSSGSEEATEEATGEQVTEEPVVYEPNILNIDFEAFTAGEDGKYIEWLNEFYSASEPTMKNEYTGMFEGYNLILITAESFSPWAVSEKYTPTLYKLVNEGFVFENYYVPAFNNTTMGEYMVCTGLLPNGLGDICFQCSIGKNMGMCMGNILGGMGYSTFAYHNHTYSYYNRDETHPNMGYTYKGNGNGLDVKSSWPESDLEMMEKSITDYIDDEQFHAYYMTVSGHMNYSFTGNSMSGKNKDLVADMDDTESMKAYVACNSELDRALEYLIAELEAKGVADKTVIAMACDHYPYALEEELTAKIGKENAEWYGLYESNLIIWSGSMTEPVHVDKVCSSIDIIPTLCNLMGIEYDSRLYSGKDILSDSPGLVIFSDMGFATDYCIYNATTGNVKATTDVQVTDEYISTVNSLVKNIWAASGRIIYEDYFEKMQKYIVD